MEGCKEDETPIETVQIEDVHIDEQGRVLIYFNQPIDFLQEIFQLVKEATEQQVEDEEDELPPTRRLQLNVEPLDATNDGAGQLIDFFSLFEVYFVEGEDASIRNDRIIRWEIIDIRESVIEMQMTWDDPSVISKDGLEDEIVLSIDTTPLG